MKQKTIQIIAVSIGLCLAYAMLATSNKASQKPQWEVITDGTHYRVRDNSNNWVS